MMEVTAPLRAVFNVSDEDAMQFLGEVFDHFDVDGDEIVTLDGMFIKKGSARRHQFLVPPRYAKPTHAVLKNSAL